MGDRAGQFTGEFDALLAGAGMEVVKIPPCSPQANDDYRLIRDAAGQGHDMGLDPYGH